MLQWIRARFPKKRARVVAAHTPSPPPPAIEWTRLSGTDLLRQLILDLGGPAVELEPDMWMPLAARVRAAAASIPSPPAFPSVATQVLSIANKPDLDLNQLVGVVQRDGALATALLRYANSPAYAPAQAVSTVRDAIGMLGIKEVVEIVVGTSGRSLYDVATRAELELYPALWQTMFAEAMANGFSSGRLALDVRGARSDRALLAGLLADIGRPLALRLVSSMVLGEDAIARPDDHVVLAVLDEVAPEIGQRLIAAMGLPDELRSACISDTSPPSPESQVARLIASIGAIQRRSARIWSRATDARVATESLGIEPLVLRTLFAQRVQDVASAAQIFG
jgi:HD-like signal output (HDOD) protein